MTHEKAKQVLLRFNAWRRYRGGPGTDGPDCPDPFEIGEAIDVAISVLKSITTKPDKEYYGC